MFVNVIFLQLKWLLTKVIVHVPMIIALRYRHTGTIQSWSHIMQASTVHGGHALDHTVIWLAMSTFQIWAQHGYSNVTRPFLSLTKGLVRSCTMGNIAWGACQEGEYSTSIYNLGPCVSCYFWNTTILSWFVYQDHSSEKIIKAALICYAKACQWF